MKFGLICLFIVTALVMRVSAKEPYYMASVFILGVNVGEDKYVPNDDNSVERIEDEEFNLRYGSIRFRLIIFKVFKEKKQPIPSNKDAEWLIYYVTDFDVSLKQLNTEFSTDFLRDLPIKCRFNTEAFKDKGKYTEEKTGASFTIINYSYFLLTKNTHVASLITNIDLSKDVKFSVFAKDGLEIRFHKAAEPLEGSIIDFKIPSESLGSSTCKSAALGPKFSMRSEEIENSETSPANQIWQGGKSKILSSFSPDGKTSISYIPFKVGTLYKTANVILVVDRIPFIRLYDRAFSSLKLEFELPLKVVPMELYDGSEIYSRNLKRKNGIWSPRSNKKKKYFLDARYSDETLYSKREIDEEAVSLTVSFKCFNMIM